MSTAARYWPIASVNQHPHAIRRHTVAADSVYTDLLRLHGFTASTRIYWAIAVDREATAAGPARISGPPASIEGNEENI